MTVLLTGATAALAAPKTDIQVFVNGDRLTGKVNSLKRGRLSFDTDATGPMGIDWEKVARLVSDQQLQVETTRGVRYFGSLVEARRDGRIIVRTESGPANATFDDGVTANPVYEFQGDRREKGPAGGPFRGRPVLPAMAETLPISSLPP